MRIPLICWLFCLCLLGGVASPLPGQQPGPAAVKKDETLPPPPQVTPKPYVPDESKKVASYAIALVAVLLIVFLVCMPARRE